MSAMNNQPLYFRGATYIRIGIVVLFAILKFTSYATAQTSDEAYGAVVQTYKLPKVNGKLFFVAPNGEPSNSGSSTQCPTLLEEAVKRASTGDAIIMRGGDYRTGNLVINQGIRIQPFEKEIPVIKGTLIADGWKETQNGVWSVQWTQLFPGKPEPWWDKERFEKDVPLHVFHNDMVFVDGKPLSATHNITSLDKETFYVDYENKMVYIGQDPSDHLIEITAHEIGLTRTIRDRYGKASDKKGLQIKGITFTQYAYAGIEIEGFEPQEVVTESELGNDVVGTVLENCSFSFARLGAFLRGNNLTIDHCTVSDTGTEGIYISASSDVVVKNSLFKRNNIERIKGYYPAAVKVFNQCHRVKVTNNKFTDMSYSNGVWFDVGNVDCDFTGNWVEGIGNVAMRDPQNPLWPLSNGYFFEISSKGICAGNVFLNCDNGVLVYNSADVKIYNNTFINSSLAIGRTGRSSANDLTFGWHSDAGPKPEDRAGHIIVNNLLAADSSYRTPLLLVWQPDSLCARLDAPQVNEVNHNFYIRAPEHRQMPLIIWSPVKNDRCLAMLQSPADLARFGTYSTNGTLSDGKTTLFRNQLQNDFRIAPNSPASESGATLPDNIRVALGLPKKDFKYVGAFVNK